MLSFLREADKEDGRPGPLSARRIAAFILIFLSVPLFVLAYRHAEKGWYVYIPGGLCLVLATVLFLFTTLADLKGIVEAAAGFKK
jgi:lipopolysaccharide export LptBFGC system permease protein LptF